MVASLIEIVSSLGSMSIIDPTVDELDQAIVTLHCIRNAAHLGIDLKDKDLMKYTEGDFHYIGYVEPPANGGEWPEEHPIRLFRILYLPYCIPTDGGTFTIMKHQRWTGTTIIAHKQYLEEFSAPFN